ncbi:hypothetical protein A3C21_02895 [Candidatus Kaiserbacteria bacterium RIFCSPHIGHO2_02_FULL_59_21]|uniref:Uncharacterized protein n=2 Tax=Candidatus Kaiseribacteriota TaxID=1752734 RepID=A0A1F6DYW8_9BACT|nr:MAG: hypothetical protein A2766_04045 [Candidatus Kaiserbacteria bacterium RIFCSPHIGHO2_01_FULL_58_22]OGG66611.1 MAG: hypothetical protein A3C21_02895 [Candidatus Kaiserbacteria bacterium RIFCSPHIGHO2_02_FULL_59_21]OGG79014.1 MAG: hypothetical protein A2952_01460 [Candidatus Kaiserbacteria bacterium RIFCSPLOWO2_01_FULL_59_34]OGG84362.1 MAG: hypothetical protein A3I47_01745 [Candidatus Kaiserbacteria bacterium RIFCSPLOWO2_02_FULL_59_19]
MVEGVERFHASHFCMEENMQRFLIAAIAMSAIALVAAPASGVSFAGTAFAAQKAAKGTLSAEEKRYRKAIAKGRSECFARLKAAGVKKKIRAQRC